MVVAPSTVETETITGGYVVVGVVDGVLDADGTSLGVLLGKVSPGVDALGTLDGILEVEISDDEPDTTGQDVEGVGNEEMPVEDR